MKRITIFKAIDKYKAQKPVPIEINNDILEETVETDEETDISIDQLLKLIQELPDQYRLVFNLFQMDGFTHKEIAELMNISEGTSKSNYHRAKLILRDKVEAINNPKYSKIN